jgi:hypothetical protein
MAGAAPCTALCSPVSFVVAYNHFRWIAGGGKLYAAGSPQHGQLGDGTDHAYNAKDGAQCLHKFNHRFPICNYLTQLLQVLNAPAGRMAAVLCRADAKRAATNRQPCFHASLVIPCLSLQHPSLWSTSRNRPQRHVATS